MKRDLKCWKFLPLKIGEREDSINIYRMIDGMENVDKKCFINLDTQSTRGHNKKLKKQSKSIVFLKEV